MPPDAVSNVYKPGAGEPPLKVTVSPGLPPRASVEPRARESWLAGSWPRVKLSFPPLCRVTGPETMPVPPSEAPGAIVTPPVPVAEPDVLAASRVPAATVVIPS